MPMSLEDPITSVEADEDILNNCGPVEIPPAPQPVQALDATGPRLMITKIECENFKSYGGRRTMGPFHKNFTCVIGPNGSGKSNVIDSMLFVFGYRASKVRSKKLSQLIHQSELVPNATSCMVAVHFQKIVDLGLGPTDYEVVPNSSFVITRRAYRDNSSSYWIDDSRAVYRDVANLLRQHGIDLDHNRFLILQGEVEQIALMKPKAPNEHEDGFLEYLEDIIGSSRFKQPLAIFANRIERLNDFRLEKLTRVKAVEKEKDELEGVRNEAMGYLRLVNQVIQMKNILYQQNLAKERQVEEETKTRLAAAQEECQNLGREIKEKSKELARTESDRDRLVDKHTELLKQHREAHAKFSECEAEDSRLRDEHAHIKATGRRLTKLLHSERQKLEEMQRLPEETDTRRQAILQQLNELEETKKRHESVYQETVSSLEEETAPLRAKVEAAEAKLAPLQSEADELSSKLTLQKQQFDLLMAGQRREQERSDKARQGAQTAQSKLMERENELADARQRLAPQSSTGRRQSSQSGSLVVGLASANRDLTEVRTKEAELTKELNELRAKLVESKSSLQADTSRGRVIKALLEAKQSGKLPGIIGRLGDLAAIAPRYDVAISTACSALDHIVTDTMDTAQQAVKFLKQNDLGLATFIALDKMKQWEAKAQAPFSTPNGNFQAERLYDLLEVPDPSVRPAFYFALRDTLVTDSMDSAVKLAFQQRQRYRVVTLQGQMIETTGAMSGGGGRPLSGRMLTNIAQVKERQQASGKSCSRQSITNEDTVDLAALERRVSQGDQELARLRDNRSRLEEVVARLTRQRDETERMVKRFETECTRLRAEAATLTAEADQAQERANQAGPSASEKKRLQSELDSLAKQVKQKCDQAEKRRAEVEALKSELLDVGSARLTAVRKRLDAIEQKTKETQDQLTKLDVNVKTAARNCEKAKTKVANLEAEVEATKSKMTEVDQKLTELVEQARVCMEAFQKIQGEVEELQKAKDEAQAKLADIETALAAVQKSEAAARRQMAQLETELSQATAKARHWQRELRGLKLHRIDDEDGDELMANDSQTLNESSSQPLDGQSKEPVEGQQNTSVTLSPSQRPKKPRELPSYAREELTELNVDLQEMRALEERIAGMAPNMAAIEEFRRKVETYLTRVAELNHVTALLTDQRKQLEDAKAKRLSEFLDGFHAITAKLKEMYQMITQGGDAELELIDSLDPFSEGIVFSVRPPKKSWKNIANLSGGEKTLSSLALVFALHHYKPTPLYVMDEIDAALDFKNVSIVGNYLKERTRNAQFIVISLRNNMFELADRLVGIYKTRNITKTVTLDHGPLSEHLSKMVVRVATMHGKEQELVIQRHQSTAATQSILPSQPLGTGSRRSSEGLTRENAIEIDDDHESTTQPAAV